MSPEERAANVEVVVDEVGDPRDPQNYVNYEKTAANIAAAVREAVLEERDKWMKVAARMVLALGGERPMSQEEFDAIRRDILCADRSIKKANP